MNYTIFMGLMNYAKHTCIGYCLLVCATTTTKAKQIAFNPPNCGQEIKDTNKETRYNYSWTKANEVNDKVTSSPSSSSPEENKTDSVFSSRFLFACSCRTVAPGPKKIGWTTRGLRSSIRIFSTWSYRPASSWNHVWNFDSISLSLI